MDDIIELILSKYNYFAKVINFTNINFTYFLNKLVIKFRKR